MKKMILAILFALFFIVGFGLIFNFNRDITGNVVFGDFPHYTKAICNESNFCQDYKIYCENGELVRTSAIDGAVIQHFDDWVDPRGEEADVLC